MFGFGKEMYVITLTPAQHRLLIQGLLRFRNKVLANNLPDEDISELLIRLMK